LASHFQSAGRPLWDRVGQCPAYACHSWAQNRYQR